MVLTRVTGGGGGGGGGVGLRLGEGRAMVQARGGHQGVSPVVIEFDGEQIVWPCRGGGGAEWGGAG